MDARKSKTAKLKGRKVLGKLNPLAEVAGRDGLGGVFTSEPADDSISYSGVESQGENEKIKLPTLTANGNLNEETLRQLKGWTRTGESATDN